MVTQPQRAEQDCDWYGDFRDAAQEDTRKKDASSRKRAVSKARWLRFGQKGGISPP
jgi:hypothetical protein